MSNIAEAIPWLIIGLFVCSDMDTKMTRITTHILAGNYPAFIKRIAFRIALWDAYRRK